MFNYSLHSILSSILVALAFCCYWLFRIAGTSIRPNPFGPSIIFTVSLKVPLNSGLRTETGSELAIIRKLWQNPGYVEVICDLLCKCAGHMWKYLITVGAGPARVRPWEPAHFRGLGGAGAPRSERNTQKFLNRSTYHFRVVFHEEFTL